MLTPSMAKFIGESSHFRSKLVSPMLPIQAVARFLSLTSNWYFIRIVPPRKVLKAPLGENLKLSVSPWRLLQAVCLILRSSGNPTTRTFNSIYRN